MMWATVLTAAASLALAERVFGPPPAPVTIVWDDGPVPGRDAAAYVLYNEDGSMKDYVIHLVPQLTIPQELVCEAVVHEYGHLVGRPHAQSGVMREVLAPWGGCHPNDFEWVVRPDAAPVRRTYHRPLRRHR